MASVGIDSDKTFARRQEDGTIAVMRAKISICQWPITSLAIDLVVCFLPPLERPFASSIYREPEDYDQIQARCRVR